MKKIKILLGFGLVLLSKSLFSQIYTPMDMNVSLSGSNYFLDASSFGDPNLSYTPGQGKLLGFPRADLTAFTFLPGASAGVVVDQGFDGTIVYNSATGKTKTGEGIQVDIKPGFYYFYNPDVSGFPPANQETGTWMPIGGSAVDMLTNKAVETNLTINGKKVMAFMDTFVTDGLETTFTLTNAPADTEIGSIYKVTIYNKAKSVYTNTVYSYDPTTKKIVTGAPYMAAIYPADTYSYILEYIIP